MKKLFMAAIVAFAFVSCSSGEKKEDEAPAPTPEETPQDAPMSFDPAGSDSGNIAGLSSVNFEYDQATLSSGAKSALDSNAQWLQANSNVSLQIEGHCDTRGTIEYNLSLGERRALTVKNYLVGLGVDPSRLSIISYGEEKPLSFGDTESDHSKNRRANFVPLVQ